MAKYAQRYNGNYTEDGYSIIEGWGIYDVDQPSQWTEVIDGKKVRKSCPYYLKWRTLVQRVFGSDSFYERNPTYRGCTVCEEWRRISNFIQWVENQPNKDWINCELDKDLLFEGNKHYSPETCVFISRKVNGFLRTRQNGRGAHMLGTHYCPDRGKFKAECNNPFKGSSFVGRFDSEIVAHKAWQAKKHGYALMLADIQTDERVVKALSERYAPDKDWTDK